MIRQLLIDKQLAEDCAALADDIDVSDDFLSEEVERGGSVLRKAADALRIIAAVAEQCTAADEAPSESRMARVAALVQDAAQEQPKNLATEAMDFLHSFSGQQFGDEHATQFDRRHLGIALDWIEELGGALLALPEQDEFRGETVAWYVEYTDGSKGTYFTMREVDEIAPECAPATSIRPLIYGDTHPPHPQVNEPPSSLTSGQGKERIEPASVSGEVLDTICEVAFNQGEGPGAWRGLLDEHGRQRIRNEARKAVADQLAGGGK